MTKAGRNRWETVEDALVWIDRNTKVKYDKGDWIIKKLSMRANGALDFLKKKGKLVYRSKGEAVIMGLASTKKRRRN